MESPFVEVFDNIGIPYAADIMNFVIITAVLSVANSGLYATSRVLWSMSRQGMVSPLADGDRGIWRRHGVGFHRAVQLFWTKSVFA